MEDTIGSISSRRGGRYQGGEDIIRYKKSSIQPDFQSKHLQSSTTFSVSTHQNPHTLSVPAKPLQKMAPSFTHPTTLEEESFLSPLKPLVAPPKVAMPDNNGHTVLEMTAPKNGQTIEAATSGATKLRRLLEDTNELIVCPGVYDGFSARIAISVGFDCLYMVWQHFKLIVNTQ